MNKRDLWIVRVVLLLFIVALGVGIMKFLISIMKQPPAHYAPDIARYVEASVIKFQTVQAEVKAPGRIRSVSQVELFSEASGKILKGDIPLKKGSSFKKGDIIFTIYPDEAELALKASKSKFLNTLATILPDIAIDFPDSETEFRSFFSSIDLNKDLPPFPDVSDEKLKIYLSSRNVWSEYYSIKSDEKKLKRYTKIAPFNGALLDVYLEIGAYTNMGGRVASAIQTNELEMEVPLERIDAVWVEVGDQVKITSKGRDLELSGTVIRKSKFIDENTQSQSVFVKIKGENIQKVLSGEFLIADFKGHPIINVMEIPRRALFNSNEVYLIKQGRLQKEIVNVIKMNDKTLFFNGLQEGDTIVVQALIGVKEGMPVVMMGDQSKSDQSTGQYRKEKFGK